MNKREFIKTLGLAGMSLPFMALGIDLKNDWSLLAEDDSRGEDFWKKFQTAYHLKSDYINLENGYYNIMPRSILEEFIRQTEKVNLHGSYYMRTMMEGEKKAVIARLAAFLGTGTDEIIITRNTTESMDTVIAGFDWKQGDEAIMALQDYGAMLDMFKQISRRYGSINKVLNIPNEVSNDEEIVDLYRKAITPKTRLIMLSHMININGHILPVRKICDMAHEYGVPVLVDGAHAIGQFDFKIKDLNCDYYASSLHKWLSVPLGAGLLWVKKERIAGIWPLLADSSFADDDIRKLNHVGTGPAHVWMSIPYAIDYLEAIGLKAKEARLRQLKDLWVNAVKDFKNVQLNTPSDHARSCAIANVGIKGIKPSEMAKTLLDKYGIWTVAIDNAGISGCRITPNIYNTEVEIAKFVKAVKEISGN